jgi:transposase
MTIPGVKRRAAEVLIAEIGVDMNAFPTAKHLASWAGMCPGNDESAGKRRSGKTRKGSKWLRATLTEAALAATRTKNSYLAAQYQRLRGRRGHSKAVTAVGHSILTAAWHMLQTGELYRDLGGDYYTRQHPDRLTKRLIRQLEALGHHVTLEPLDPAARREFRFRSSAWCAAGTTTECRVASKAIASGSLLLFTSPRTRSSTGPNRQCVRPPRRDRSRSRQC